MAILQWSNELDIGVREMNGEHQQILNLMNRLHDLYEKKAPRDQLVRALKDLATYTVKHFSDEEAYMAKIEFVGLESHKVLHKNLLKKVTDFLTAIESGKKEVGPDLFEFLKFWLAAHIRGVDIQYGRVAQEMKRAG